MQFSLLLSLEISIEDVYIRKYNNKIISNDINFLHLDRNQNLKQG